MRAPDGGLDGTLAAYHEAARAFAKGDPEPVKKLFSHEGDVTLANPFGPPVHGWHDVSAALDFASSRFRDGDVTAFERIEAYCQTPLRTDPVTPLKLTPPMCSVVGLVRAEKPGPFLLS